MSDQGNNNCSDAERRDGARPPPSKWTVELRGFSWKVERTASGRVYAGSGPGVEVAPGLFVDERLLRLARHNWFAEWLRDMGGASRMLDAGQVRDLVLRRHPGALDGAVTASPCEGGAAVTRGGDDCVVFLPRGHPLARGDPVPDADVLALLSEGFGCAITPYDVDLPELRADIASAAQ